MLKGKSASNASKLSDAKKLIPNSQRNSESNGKKSAAPVSTATKSNMLTFKLLKINPNLIKPPEDKKFSIRRPSSLSIKSNTTTRTKDFSPVKAPLSARAPTKSEFSMFL